MGGGAGGGGGRGGGGDKGGGDGETHTLVPSGSHVRFALFHVAPTPQTFGAVTAATQQPSQKQLRISSWSQNASETAWHVVAPQVRAHGEPGGGGSAGGGGVGGDGGGEVGDGGSGEGEGGVGGEGMVAQCSCWT